MKTGSYDSVRQSASTSRIGILSGNNGENGENSENSENGKTGNQNKNSKERPRTAKSAPRVSKSKSDAVPQNVVVIIIVSLYTRL